MMANARISKWFVAISILLFCCRQQKESINRLINDQIVLINIGDADRQEISKALDRISSCKPRIIAINELFEKAGDQLADSLLSSSIKQAGNVILLSAVENGNYIQPSSIFTQGCRGLGVYYFQSDDGNSINKFKTSILNDSNGDLLWTFPFAIAMYYQPGTSLLNITRPDYFYDINFSENTFDNPNLSLDGLDKIDCNSMKDKIVLIGYLGPRDQETFLTPLDGKKKMHATLIYANIISTILAKDFQESANQE